MPKTQELKNETAVAVSEPTLPMAASASSKDPFEAYADSISPQTIVGDLLKFAKGEFFAGKDADR